jgi:hypothetical protein
MLSGCASRPCKVSRVPIGERTKDITSSSVSDEMRVLIERHRVSTYGLDVLGLPEIDPGDESWREAGETEVFDLPSRPHTFDATTFAIILDKRTCRYWITRFYGEDAVQTRVFGPGRL